MFNSETVDRILELRRNLGTDSYWDGGVYMGLLAYFGSLFAAEVEALASSKVIFFDDEGDVFDCGRADASGMRLLVPAAYCNYVVELAWSGPGTPDGSLDEAEAAEFRDSITYLVQALAIADKLGIKTNEVVEYYRTRAKWMPAPGATWAKVHRYRAKRRRSRAREQAA